MVPFQFCNATRTLLRSSGKGSEIQSPSTDLKLPFWTVKFPDDPAMPRPQTSRIQTPLPTSQGRHASSPNPSPQPAAAAQTVRPARDAPSPWTDTDRRRTSALRSTTRADLQMNPRSAIQRPSPELCRTPMHSFAAPA